jgi:anthranilate phosphoribosyltransferase
VNDDAEYHTMQLTALIKEIGRGAKGARDLGEDDAAALFAAMLEGRIGELELGAILMAFRIKGESVGELRGFYRAVQDRVTPIASGRNQPVVFASYNGARKHANLLPLLALMLEWHGVPVLIHGVRSDAARVTTAGILAALDIPVSETAAHAAARIATGKVAFLPTEIMSPTLATLLATRERLGVRSSAHTMAKLADPFGGQSLRVIGVTHPHYLARLHEFLLAAGADALLLRGTEGEPFANTRKQPAIEHFHDGAVVTLLEPRHFDHDAELPAHDSAALTAQWTRKVLAGEVRPPEALINQLACCLFASRRAATLEEAMTQARSPLRSASHIALTLST